jgi:hypothetical protein
MNERHRAISNAGTASAELVTRFPQNVSSIFLHYPLDRQNDFDHLVADGKEPEFGGPPAPSEPLFGCYLLNIEYVRILGSSLKIFRSKVAIAAKAKTMVQKNSGHESLILLDVVTNTQRNWIVHIFKSVKCTSVG